MGKGRILVSGCLLGQACRYDGAGRKVVEKIQRLLEDGECLIPVCPEQLGGLTTPRPRNHLTWNSDEPTVINDQGREVTEEFLRGARETLRIARLVKAGHAIFKSRSPSCGEEGVTTRLLRKEGVTVEIIEVPRA